MKLIATIMVLATVWSCGSIAEEFHVSPQGDDANPGTLSRPFCSLARARDAVRGISRPLKADVTVTLHDGLYRLTEPVMFTAEDSGSAGHPVIYRAAPGAKPVLSGGRAVTGWQRHGQSERVVVWRAPAGKAVFRQVYIDGQRAIRARTPNRECDHTFGPYWPANAEQESTGGSWSLVVQAEHGKPLLGLARASEVEVVLLSHWYQQRLLVGRIVAAGDTVRIQPLHQEGKFNKQERFYRGSWFFLENALLFLDAPREWHHDAQEGYLYVGLPPGADPNALSITVPVVETLLAIRGTAERPVEHLTFEGLTFTDTTWTQPGLRGMNFTQFAQPIPVQGEENKMCPPGAICAEHARRLILRHNTIRHAGATGIQFVEDVDDADIEGNRIHDIAGNGMVIDCHALRNPPPEKQSVDVAIWNNEITRCGRDYTNGGGILANNVRRLIVEHNHIHDMPYSGMQIGNQPPKPAGADIGCGENRIRFNHVHHCVQLHDDGGGIYTLGGFQKGTVIERNHLHDIARGPWAGRNGITPIYLDNGTSGVLVQDNTAEAKERNGSAGNTLRNNRPDQPEIAAMAGLCPGYSPRVLGQ